MDENLYGYGDVDEVVKEQGGGGKYLQFKKGDKGRIIQIRIASEPKYVNQHWADSKPLGNCSGDDCQYCGKNVAPKDKLQKTAKWGWIVIDREDEEVKVFTGATQIARAIKDNALLKNMSTKKVMWGDPRGYDIQIERTEIPGAGYYKVTPVVGSQGPLTPEEQAKVEACGYDLVAELKGGKKSDNTGNYGGSKESMETAPEDEVNPDDIPDDLGEEAPANAGGSEDVNEDDIPF